jgi:hypothetical protein
MPRRKMPRKQHLLGEADQHAGGQDGEQQPGRDEAPFDADEAHTDHEREQQRRRPQQ